MGTNPNRRSRGRGASGASGIQLPSHSGTGRPAPSSASQRGARHAQEPHGRSVRSEPAEDFLTSPIGIAATVLAVTSLSEGSGASSGGTAD